MENSLVDKKNFNYFKMKSFVQGRPWEKKKVFWSFKSALLWLKHFLAFEIECTFSFL